MVLFVQIAPYIPLFNLIFFIAGVPFVLWLNNKTKNDWICLGLGIIYMACYGLIAQPSWDECFFFFWGILVGYVTDYWGVNSKKWKYHPWDPDFGFSYYVGFAWGMVSIFTYNISKVVLASLETLFLPGILFLIPTIVLEWRYGETRRNQYFLFARVLFTFLAFFISNNIALICIACFVGSYIEFVGVYWIKNWLYIDHISFLFLSFGYSLMVLSAKIIIDIISGAVEPFVLVFFVLAIFSYFIDVFWAQKKIVIDSSKAVIAAKNFQKK
ncbi:MAG: hypothetical protein ACXADY_21535 [Candidatus Hodarchaeales archaeon]|jgi:hypothetical protein